MARLRVAILVLTIHVATAAPARGKTRAWAAAKQAFPAHLVWVGGVRVDELRREKAFAAFWSAIVRTRAGGVAIADALRSGCGVELPELVDSIAFGIDARDRGVVVLALHDMDRDMFEACVEATADTLHARVAVKRSGATTSFRHGTAAAYVRWLGAGVLAITTRPGDREALAALTAGGLATERAMKTVLSETRTDATVWGVTATPHTVDITGIDVEVAHGWTRAIVDGGALVGELHLITTDAKIAAAAAAKNQRELTEVSRIAEAPPAIRAVLGGVHVKATGREIVYTAAASLADLLKFAQLTRILAPDS